MAKAQEVTDLAVTLLGLSGKHGVATAFLRPVSPQS
jgi:hypothetical protein